MKASSQYYYYYFFTEIILSLTKKKRPKLRKNGLHRKSMNSISNWGMQSAPAEKDTDTLATALIMQSPSMVGSIVSHKLKSHSTENLSRKSMINIFEEPSSTVNNLTALPSASSGGSGMPPAMPTRFQSSQLAQDDLAPEFELPLPLNVAKEENEKLLKAVKTFSQHVHNHIQAIVNSAILYRYEQKQNARALRTLKIRSDDLHVKEKVKNISDRQKFNGNQVTNSLDSSHIIERPNLNTHKGEHPVFQRPPAVPKMSIKPVQISESRGEYPTLSEARFGQPVRFSLPFEHFIDSTY